MTWAPALIWTFGGLILLCAAVVLWPEMRDRKNRGMRVRNGEVYRERITRTLPDNWLRDFADRNYEDTQ
jgi:hypothetical protein